MASEKGIFEKIVEATKRISSYFQSDKIGDKLKNDLQLLDLKYKYENIIEIYNSSLDAYEEAKYRGSDLVDSEAMMKESMDNYQCAYENYVMYIQDNYGIDDEYLNLFIEKANTLDSELVKFIKKYGDIEKITLSNLNEANPANQQEVVIEIEKQFSSKNNSNYYKLEGNSKLLCVFKNSSELSTYKELLYNKNVDVSGRNFILIENSKILELDKFLRENQHIEQIMLCFDTIETGNIDFIDEIKQHYANNYFIKVQEPHVFDLNEPLKQQHQNEVVVQSEVEIEFEM